MRLFFRILGVIAMALAAAASTYAQTLSPPQGSALRTVLIVGDSLSAEYGLPRGSGWVAMLAQRIAKQYTNYQVVNASISGDTTSGGLTRLPELLRRYRPAVVVLELGANDALRGLSLDMTETNLGEMAHAAHCIGAYVLIVGMQIPPNYGAAYTERFKQIFANVAKKERTALAPFFLAGIAENRTLFQSDGIHPNQQAQQQLLNNIWPQLGPLLSDK